ncbi:hypothetical protein HDU87_004566 [Geranomyces variabilis]|uniref:Uncharacterized protein n=1 Tax=Geranomyces variabilis TaxID=109894 RepID=A0AAD5TIL9_9FUNG|nr:hypothetical protein HDU87_004566 [Geranomyces variabilis]
MPPPGFVEMVSLSDLEVEGGAHSTTPPLPDASAPTENTAATESPTYKPPQPALLAYPGYSFRNNQNQPLQIHSMSELPHRSSRQFATAAESATAPTAAFPPPAYTPSGPPPRYIPPRRSRHEYDEARREALTASFGFESSEESDIRPAGIRWWMVGIIGSDLVASTLLLFLTLASLSQSSAGPLNPAAIVLPFIYVFLSVWGKSGVSRDCSTGKVVFTLTYLMRWVADIVGTAIAIRASSGTNSADGGDGYGNSGDSASPTAWVLETLVFDAALAFVLIVRLSAEYRYVQGRVPLDAASLDMTPSDTELTSGRRPPRSRHALATADEGFRTSVLTVSSSSSDGSTLNEHPGISHHIAIPIPHGNGGDNVPRPPHEKEDDPFHDVPLGVFVQRRAMEDDADDDSAPLALILARLQGRDPPSQ